MSHPPRLRRAAAIVAPFRGPVVAILVLTLIGVGLAAIEPLALKWIIDAEDTLADAPDARELAEGERTGELPRGALLA
jgi:hypothetical protein